MRKRRKVMRQASTQTLVLFDDVLDGEKLLQSPEIKKLVEYFYGNYELSVVQVEKPEKLHGWLRDEQYKTDAQSGAMIYPFKARFDDLILETHSDEFSGPLYAQMFSTKISDSFVLTITCHWSDGIFLNDYYVAGAVVDTQDLQSILGRIQR